MKIFLLITGWVLLIGNITLMAYWSFSLATGESVSISIVGIIVAAGCVLIIVKSLKGMNR